MLTGCDRLLDDHDGGVFSVREGAIAAQEGESNVWASVSVVVRPGRAQGMSPKPVGRLWPARPDLDKTPRDGTRKWRLSNSSRGLSRHLDPPLRGVCGCRL